MPDCTAGCEAGLIASWNLLLKHLLLKQRPAVSRLVFLCKKHAAFSRQESALERIEETQAECAICFLG
jgi:hypothetical protein